MVIRLTNDILNQLIIIHEIFQRYVIMIDTPSQNKVKSILESVEVT